MLDETGFHTFCGTPADGNYRSFNIDIGMGDTDIDTLDAHVFLKKYVLHVCEKLNENGEFRKNFNSQQILRPCNFDMFFTSVPGVSAAGADDAVYRNYLSAMQQKKFLGMDASAQIEICCIYDIEVTKTDDEICLTGVCGFNYASSEKVTVVPKGMIISAALVLKWLNILSYPKRFFAGYFGDIISDVRYGEVCSKKFDGVCCVSSAEDFLCFVVNKETNLLQIRSDITVIGTEEELDDLKTCMEMEGVSTEFKSKSLDTNTVSNEKFNVLLANGFSDTFDISERAAYAFIWFAICNVLVDNYNPIKRYGASTDALNCVVFSESNEYLMNVYDWTLLSGRVDVLADFDERMVREKTFARLQTQYSMYLFTTYGVLQVDDFDAPKMANFVTLDNLLADLDLGLTVERFILDEKIKNVYEDAILCMAARVKWYRPKYGVCRSMIGEVLYCIKQIGMPVYNDFFVSTKNMSEDHIRELSTKISKCLKKRDLDYTWFSDMSSNYDKIVQVTVLLIKLLLDSNYGFEFYDDFTYEYVKTAKARGVIFKNGKWRSWNK